MIDPAPNPSSANPSDEHLQFRLTRVDQQICLEHDIIGQRMSWLMISQSFLFSAFAISISRGEPPQLPAARVLQHLVPLVGIAGAVTVGLALLAVHRVIDRLRRERDKLEQIASARGFESLGATVSRADYVFGDLPSKALPWILLGVWMVLLASAVG